jgi:hypothetical protein
MKHTKIRLIIGLLLLAVGSLLAGCTTRGAKDTSIPWSRPADWEGQIPGMTQQGN